MSKAAPTPPEALAYEALCRSHREGKIIFFTDPQVLNRPGSPVYNPVDIFAPSLVLMASSLTLLFAFGLVEWMVALVFVLVYQVYGARYLVEWRLHRRTVRAVLTNPYNLKLLWEMGGLAVALKDFPEKNCIAPNGNWRAFCGEWLIEEPRPEETEPQTVLPSE